MGAYVTESTTSSPLGSGRTIEEIPSVLSEEVSSDSLAWNSGVSLKHLEGNPTGSSVFK